MNLDDHTTDPAGPDADLSFYHPQGQAEHRRTSVLFDAPYSLDQRRKLL